MNFFTELAAINYGLDITMRIKQKNGKLTISVLPDGLANIQPLIVTGTPEELDNGFVEAIIAPLNETRAVVANHEQYSKDLAELDAANKQKVEDKKSKSKPAAKPEKKTSAAPKEETEEEDDNEETEEDKPVTAKKKPAQKKEKTPKPLKTEPAPEEPAQPKALSIF